MTDTVTNCNTLPKIRKKHKLRSDTNPLMQAVKLRYIHNMPISAISDITSIPRSTIHCQLSEIENALLSPEDVELYEKNKSRILSSLESVTIQNMLDTDRLKAASFNNLAYGLSQVFNMNRITQGLSTAIVDYTNTQQEYNTLRAERESMEKIIDITPINQQVVCLPAESTRD